MNHFFFWSGVMLLIASAAKLLEGLYARTRVGRLADLTPPDISLGPRPPRLSLIVPACNEERSVAGAVRSMLNQDYPDLEVVLVNDRSTDRTGAIMEQLAREHPGIRVVQIDHLPERWLGKNHALYQGARHATGEWLLFADADVHLDPTACRRAVAYAESRRLDHLTLAPAMTVRGYWLQGWVAFFIMSLLAYMTPYKANNPRSREGFGVGAFNLIRLSAYERIGTHRAISLRPDDDVRLGQRVKRMGLKQNLLNGTGLLEVEWYTSVWEAIRGLEKNTFAGMEYSLVRAVGSILGVLAVLVWPFAGVWLAPPGPARWLYLGAVLCQLGLFVLSNGLQGGRTLLLALSYPIAGLLFAFTVTRSMWLTLSQGGITWRGTFYPLDLLRSQSGLPGEDDLARP